MAEKVIIDIELKGLGDAKKGLDDLTKQQSHNVMKLSKRLPRLRSTKRS
jgi:hypothetical protein